MHGALAPLPSAPDDAFLLAIRCPSGRIDILKAALAIALDARPDADVASIELTLDTWGERLSRRIRHERAESELLTGVLLLDRLLFEEESFTGDTDTPMSPANSEIDLVMKRRRGLPITLGLIMVEVGKRAGLPLYGISFPGRFLIGLATAPRALLFDPYRGGQIVLPEE